mmetsp:Transcript_5762/g.11530  ORF Transcript_5762/g.11530 Transcript_5762/m.11530 type:complete len:590 (-) Transcript_5762:171-1940(-)
MEKISPIDQPQVGSQPLRRATYTKVDQLIYNQYEVDLQKLEYELSKVRMNTTSSAEKRDTTPPPRADDEHSSGSDEKAEAPAEVSAEVESLSRPRTGSSPTSPSSSRAWSGGDPSHPLSGVYPDSGTISVGSSQFQLHQTRFMQQNRLQPPRDGFNLCLLVGKVELVVDKLRVDGTKVLVAEVDVGDETGSISLRARDDQIEVLRSISEDSGAVVLRNCTMELYQGRHLRLAVSKWGKMRAYPDGIESTPDPPKILNKDLNFSIIDLNTVATSKVIIEPLPPSLSPGKGRKQNYQNPPKFASFKVDDDLSARNRPRRYQYQRKKNQHHPKQYPMSPGSPLNPQHLYHGHGRGSDTPILGGLPPHHMHYPQYPSGAASVDPSYSYQSLVQGQGGPHHHFLPSGHYKRQQEILYQQYEMQQRHAHQMHMLQQQQESQRRMLEQHHMGHQGGQGISSIIPEITRVESHGSAADYSVSSSIGGMAPNLQMSPFPHSPPNMTSTQAPMGMGPDYHFSLQGGVAGGGELPQQRNFVPSYDNNPYHLSNATIISPPMSPQHYGHQGPRSQNQRGGWRQQHRTSPANQDKQIREESK